MNENLLRERLNAAAADDYAADPGDDLQRGQTAVRRRRALALGGSAIATAGLVAAVFGAGQLIGSDDQPGGQGGPAIAGQTTAPTRDGSAAPTEDDPTVVRSESTTVPSPTIIDPMDGEIGLRPWRYDLYHLAQDVLDPDGNRLNYDTDSLQGGGGRANGQDIASYGIKLGWQGQGDTGEGMVQLGIASPGGTKLLYPCGYFGPCETVTVPGHGEIELSGDPDGGGGYAIRLVQADGEAVQVVVDPQFANNSLTPTSEPLVGLDRVLDLAQSPDFNLP